MNPALIVLGTLAPDAQPLDPATSQPQPLSSFVARTRRNP